ncbi:MAG: type I 3-dehydroquinate dehydratase [Nitrospirota bacterium]|nr:MAG: type I 3-dehydroquinate dehydratase [Nitrospirota bacterium]
MPDIRIGAFERSDFPLIAVPLTDRSLSSELNLDNADIIEMRVDMFEEHSEKHVVHTLLKAKEMFDKPLIATIRSISEGGAVEIDDKTRKKLFKSLIKHTDAVDIEINSEIFSSTVKLARKNNKLSIGSFHDFIRTPDASELEEAIKRGRSFKADIVKIAVMPNSMDDLQTITDMTLKHSKDGIISIAMGELGMASRIFLPMIGSLITFASIDVESAPGQLSLRKMKEFLSVLKTTD